MSDSHLTVADTDSLFDPATKLSWRDPPGGSGDNIYYPPLVTLAFFMSDVPIASAVRCITRDEPGRDELRRLERNLRTETPDTRYTVERYALAELIASMQSYLSYIEQDLEKSVGLRCADERQRIFNTLTHPETSDPRGQVEQLLGQWQAFETYTRDDIVRATTQQRVSD